MEIKMSVVKKSGRLEPWSDEKILQAVRKSAARVDYTFSNAEEEEILAFVQKRALAKETEQVSVEQLHSFVEMALSRVNPEVEKSYKDFRNFKKAYEEDYGGLEKFAADVRFRGNTENANKDSSLVSVQQAIIRGELGRIMYRRQFLSAVELDATKDGYIYIHDMDFRLDCANCCLFDIKSVLDGGFEMANMHYNEPTTLRVAFDVIGDVVLSAAPQQYGGFTLPEIDTVLAKYARLSYDKYMKLFVEECGLTEEKAEALAWEKTVKEAEQGFQGWEYKFNTVGSSRGDYPFITVTIGNNTERFAKMLAIACLNVRAGGQGAKGHKKPVLFPKIVFLYDEAIHGEGKESEDVFEAGLLCSSKSMYPDWLSLSGKGYIASMYKQYKKVISPMGCRAFLSPYWEKGGQDQFDETDQPVFVGRFNIGAISLNLPMILRKAQIENKDFYEVLDYYLEMIRSLHKRTYNYLGEMLASTNPLGYCQGGFYGGHLKPNDKIAPLLDAATASFGITALNELQRLYNGKSIAEDGQFALEVMEHINAYVKRIKKEDHHLYAVYGTPAESLCGKQVKQFRKKYGIIENVSDREYVSNSFHCHVSEELTPIEKQDKEARFWELFNGGKIQYVRYPLNYNLEAEKTLIRRAMEMGFYEGVNMALSYCDDCGHEEIEMDDVCPVCGGHHITKIDRMNGYLAYSRVNGKSRLNDAKMAEIADRKSM